MSVRDDTPEGGAPERPAGNDNDATRPDPERAPLGYYYDDGTNYETYDPDREEGPEGQDGESGADA